MSALNELTARLAGNNLTRAELVLLARDFIERALRPEVPQERLPMRVELELRLSLAPLDRAAVLIRPYPLRLAGCTCEGWASGDPHSRGCPRAPEDA